MSQKNGHALESVTLTAMLRRWTSSLLLIAVTAASALSAMILQNLTIRQENALSIRGKSDRTKHRQSPCGHDPFHCISA